MVTELGNRRLKKGREGKNKTDKENYNEENGEKGLKEENWKTTEGEHGVR
jgi:hypothetical protein